jgi:molybdenum cofactor cytidylyltransferase
MDLMKALRLSKTSRAALVGSGGKTTAMFQLARDYGSRVIVTTTTHLALEQLKLADQHFTAEKESDLPGPGQKISGDVLLFSGPQAETDRVKGPDPKILNKLADLADQWECPLLIEADGARQLPIKAPGAHEPPVPDFINAVIVLVGLSGLGKPLDALSVHRPGLFSKLVDLPEGSELTSKHLVAALISPQGGLKNIPPAARKILLINKIDCFPNWRTFHDHMPVLLKYFNAVGFTVLEDQMLLELHERIAGIVLAAGGSTRFGTPKQLLDWHGKPLVRHVAETALEGGLSPVLVITGADQEDISCELKGLPVKAVYNPDWELGQGTSVKKGIEFLSKNVGAAVFLLVDQPFIPPELLMKLRKAHAIKRAPIIQPEVNGDRVNPVLFDQGVFPELLHLKGDTGGRVLFNAYTPRTIPWDDDLIKRDIDTLEDYEELRSVGE